MFKKAYLFGLLVFCLQSSAQIIRTKLPDSISYWKKENKVGLDISQITFVNWNAGGNNSVSGLLKGQFIRTYVKENIHWKNELIALLERSDTQDNSRRSDIQSDYDSEFYAHL